nr:transcriptional regulator [Neisseria meningitidis alpha275]
MGLPPPLFFWLLCEVKSVTAKCLTLTIYWKQMMGNKLTLPAELPDEQDLRAVLAYNMRLFRVNKGWSQEELARQCGLDRTYVSAVERKRWNIALSNIEKMAAALGVAAYQLLLPPQERLKLMTNSADTRQMPSESGI